MRGLEEKTIAGLPVDSFWPVAWGKNGLFYNVRLSKEEDIAPIRVSVFRCARNFVDSWEAVGMDYRQSADILTVPDGKTLRQQITETAEKLIRQAFHAEFPREVKIYHGYGWDQKENQ